MPTQQANIAAIATHKSRMKSRWYRVNKVGMTHTREAAKVMLRGSFICCNLTNDTAKDNTSVQLIPCWQPMTPKKIDVIQMTIAHGA